jgi:hypothetical protein
LIEETEVAGTYKATYEWNGISDQNMCTKDDDCFGWSLKGKHSIISSSNTDSILQISLTL